VTPPMTPFSPSPSISQGYCPPPTTLTLAASGVSSAVTVNTTSSPSKVQGNFCGYAFGGAAAIPQQYYLVTMPAGAGTLYVDTCTGGPQYDTVVAVLTGTTNPCLTALEWCVAANDDAPPSVATCAYRRSWLYVNQGGSSPATDYVILVSGWTSPGAAFTLNYTYVGGSCVGGCPSNSPTPSSTMVSATPSNTPVSATNTPAALSPATLPGLALWLRPGQALNRLLPANFALTPNATWQWDSYVNADTVSAVPNPANPNNRPTPTANQLAGAAGMVFSAASQSELVSAVDLSSGAYTIFMLISMNTTTLTGGRSYGTVLTQVAATDIPFAMGFSSAGYMDTATVTNNATIPPSGPTVVNGQWILYELFVQPGGSMTLMKWGAVVGSAALPPGLVSYGPKGLRIGALPSGNQPVADFTLVELTVWNTVLDTNARQSAEGYIANTYGLGAMLPPSSPYYPLASPAPFQVLPSLPQAPNTYQGLQVRTQCLVFSPSCIHNRSLAQHLMILRIPAGVADGVQRGWQRGRVAQRRRAGPRAVGGQPAAHAAGAG
jgi:hypothetical protein